MGMYSQHAYYANLLPIWPPLHEGGRPADHECSPIIKGACVCCGRVYQWCDATDETVRAICAEAWVCRECAP
jgi:hypothetical protein